MSNLIETYKLLVGWDRITLTNGPYMIYLARLSRYSIYYSIEYKTELVCEDIIETKKHFSSIIDLSRDLINNIREYHNEYKWECYHMEKKLNQFLTN